MAAYRFKCWHSRLEVQYFLTRHNHHAFVCLCNNKYGMHYEDTNCYQITELHCKIRMKEIAIHAWVVPVMVISLLA